MATLDAGNWIAILVAIVGVASAWGGFRVQIAEVRAEAKGLKVSIEKLGARIGEAEKLDAAFEERIAHIADSVGLRKDIRRALQQAGLNRNRRPSQMVNLPNGDDEDSRGGDDR